MRATLVALTVPLLVSGLFGCASVQPAGSRNPDWPHVIANGANQWLPMPGYVWAHVDQNGNPIDLAVQWQPGNAYWYLGRITQPHVVAASSEGGWVPEDGYTWASRSVSDLTVVDLQACNPSARTIAACTNQISKAQEDAPYLAAFYFGRAIDYYAQRDYDRAASDFSRALALAGRPGFGVSESTLEEWERWRLSAEMQMHWAEYLRE